MKRKHNRQSVAKGAKNDKTYSTVQELYEDALRQAWKESGACQQDTDAAVLAVRLASLGFNDQRPTDEQITEAKEVKQAIKDSIRCLKRKSINGFVPRLYSDLITEESVRWRPGRRFIDPLAN